MCSLCLVAVCAREGAQPDTASSRSAAQSAPDRHLPWVVTPRGIGPLHAGMSRVEAEAVVGGPLAIDGDTAWKDCAYVPGEHLPPGVQVMVEDGTIARVDIVSGSIATAEGARIGDTEDRIRQLYAGHVVTTPHKYTDGHYLTINAAAPADSMFRIVFETDRGRVTLYRAGRVPPVEYAEGCA